MGRVPTPVMPPRQRAMHRRRRPSQPPRPLCCAPPPMRHHQYSLVEGRRRQLPALTQCWRGPSSALAEYLMEETWTVAEKITSRTPDGHRKHHQQNACLGTRLFPDDRDCGVTPLCSTRSRAAGDGHQGRPVARARSCAEERRGALTACALVGGADGSPRRSAPRKCEKRWEAVLGAVGSAVTDRARRCPLRAPFCSSVSRGAAD
jgi:hypothetical protein